MAFKRKIRRKARRKPPPLRHNTASNAQVLVGGAHDPSEKAASQLAAGALAPKSPASTPGTIHRSPTSSPKIAPGTKPAPAPKAGADAVNALGAGRSLSPQERGYFEPRLHANLSAVRVHQGANANNATRALDARAFAKGTDIALSDQANTQATLAHELAHVVQDGSDVLRRELINQPPGREGDPPQLSKSQTADALAYNRALLNADSTERVLDIIGKTGRRSFETKHIAEIQNWQANFRIKPDGKLSLLTLETIAKELISAGHRQSVIDFIIDAHDMDRSNVDAITYKKDHLINRAGTINNSSGGFDIIFGPHAFAQGYRGLVHTTRHEIDHADMRTAGVTSRDIGEFSAEAIEILSVGMLEESTLRMFNDADALIKHWVRLSVADRRKNFVEFKKVREVVKRRFNAATDGEKAGFRAVMNRYNAQVKP